MFWRTNNKKPHKYAGRTAHVVRVWVQVEELEYPVALEGQREFPVLYLDDTLDITVNASTLFKNIDAYSVMPRAEKTR